MIVVIGVFIVSCLVTLYELPSLRKRKLKREAFAFFLLLIIGDAMCISFILKIQIPNPADLFMTIFRPITDGIDYYFK